MKNATIGEPVVALYRGKGFPISHAKAKLYLQGVLDNSVCAQQTGFKDKTAPKRFQMLLFSHSLKVSIEKFNRMIL